MRTQALASFLLLSLLTPVAMLSALAAGCGTRTGLLIDDESPSITPTDAGRDRSPPRLLDAELEPDDGLPLIDARPPPDGSFHSNCPDAGATLVYVVTQENDLYSFYPPDLSFTRVGQLACPTSGGTPFSMTVDRKGVAYVVFTTGELFRVSTATAACVATKFVPGQLGFKTFGMGYVADTTDPGETLFIAQNDLAGGQTTSGGLGIIDTTTLKVSRVGSFVPSIPPSELTGTGDGRLFAWGPNAGVSGGSHLYEVDKTNARILGQNPLKVGSAQNAFAFAYWGGMFWIFTGLSAQSTVTRFDLTTQSEANVATLNATIVGAGVSTCAPSP
jgi:hypothetical protein